MKIISLEKRTWQLIVVLSVFLPTQIAANQESNHNYSSANINQKIEQAVDYEKNARALKATDSLVKEQPNYYLELPSKPDLIAENNPTLNSPQSMSNNTRFGRELVLEDSRLYRDEANICVIGKIRNRSRSPIVNPVYAIADFLAKDNSYLGSKATRINPQPITTNETVSFSVFADADISQVAKVKLHFQGVNRERKVILYPMTNSPTDLTLSQGKCPSPKIF